MESPSLAQASPVSVSAFTPEQLLRLIRLKARRALEARGFTPAEARRLLFARWLFLNRRMGMD